jgi:amino acid permease
MVGLSFLLSMTLSVSVMSFGFLTFGGAASGLILNNYANIDPLMTFCRVAVAAAIVASYPLTFVGVREGTFDLLNVPVKDRTPSAVNKMTFALLAAFTG